jgi:hypothetical protein
VARRRYGESIEEGAAAPLPSNVSEATIEQFQSQQSSLDPAPFDEILTTPRQ